MNLRKLFSAFYPWLDERKRPAWKPTVANKDGKPTDSKFAGTPYLPDGKWPNCGHCKQPMSFILQLNLSQLPKDAPNFGQGLIQFFFCRNELARCSSDNYGLPFAKSHFLRLLIPKKIAPKIKIPKFDKLIAVKQIVDWTRFEEYPNAPERRKFGMDLDYDNVLHLHEMSLKLEVEDDDYYKWNDKLTFQGNKLAGWPSWVQDVSYPKCPTCEQMMDNLVFQVTRGKNLPDMLGYGIGQILQCRKHKSKLAFAWACT